ncbi:hypothetical protein PVAG01_08459 [Phlyctema vagabunda]|uniref:Uncharacterized protein n=1 Tax=Phlyctema vagabunda TaxID=108571 RepID=A0ABR4P9J1_9HELO
MSDYVNQSTLSPHFFEGAVDHDQLGPFDMQYNQWQPNGLTDYTNISGMTSTVPTTSNAQDCFYQPRVNEDNNFSNAMPGNEPGHSAPQLLFNPSPPSFDLGNGLDTHPHDQFSFQPQLLEGASAASMLSSTSAALPEQYQWEPQPHTEGALFMQPSAPDCLTSLTDWNTSPSPFNLDSRQPTTTSYENPFNPNQDSDWGSSVQ